MKLLQCTLIYQGLFNNTKCKMSESWFGRSQYDKSTKQINYKPSIIDRRWPCRKKGATCQKKIKIGCLYSLQYHLKIASGGWTYSNHSHYPKNHKLCSVSEGYIIKCNNRVSIS